MIVGRLLAVVGWLVKTLAGWLPKAVEGLPEFGSELGAFVQDSARTYNAWFPFVELGRVGLVLVLFQLGCWVYALANWVWRHIPTFGG